MSKSIIKIVINGKEINGLVKDKVSQYKTKKRQVKYGKIYEFEARGRQVLFYIPKSINADYYILLPLNKDKVEWKDNKLIIKL